jgi:hypothetical protein
VLISAILTSCSTLSREDKICIDLVQEFSKELKDDRAIVLIGNGVRIPNKIIGIDPSYKQYGLYTIEQARMNFIYIVEKLINKINSNEEVIPYLGEYPFTSQNVEISVCFGTSLCDIVKPPYISHVINVNDKIFYHSNNLETGASILIHSEPYSEGLKIYRENSH